MSHSTALVPYIQPKSKKDTATKMTGSVNKLTTITMPNSPNVGTKMPASKMQPRYANKEQMKECAARLLAVRSNPFTATKALPCNVSSTAANTIRVRVYSRGAGECGASGYGYVMFNTNVGIANDFRSIAVSNGGTTGVGFYAAPANNPTFYATTGSFFTGSQFQPNSDNPIRVRRVAAGVRILPISAPIYSQGVFQPWQAQGSGTQQDVTDAQLNSDVLAPICPYQTETKYLATWTPSSADEENWIEPGIFQQGGIDAVGGDLAVGWIRALPSAPFIWEVVGYYEVESFSVYSTLALPSEHDPSGAAAVSTAMARIVRTNVATPARSEEGFFTKAWNWIKNEGSQLLNVALPDIASAAGKALLAAI